MSTSIAFDIIARDKASKTFDKVGDSADRSGGKLSKFGKAGVAGLAVVGTATVAAGTYLFNYAAKLEQMGAKAETVFGKQLGMVDKWANKNAHAMGLTTREATGLAANFGDLLIPMGFARKEAAKMSTDVVGLSGALSQWSGGTKSAAEVSEILSAAMLGETDGLKSLGIAISAADIEARLAAKGQKELTGSARQQAEAQAIQALIMEKSTDAQDAYAKGGAPLLSAQNKLKATLFEVRDELAVKLIPAFAKGADFMVAKVMPAAARLGSELKNKLGPTFAQIGDFVKAEVIPALSDLAGFVKAKVIPVVMDIAGFIQDKFIPAAMKLAGNVLDGLRAAFKDVGESIEENRPFLETLVDGFKKVAGFVTSKVMPVLGKLAEVYLRFLAKEIKVAIFALKMFATGFLTLGIVGVKAFRFLLTAALGTFGGILKAAEVGMGWIPGIGGKIKKAKDAFDDFRDKTLENLKKTENALIKVRDRINEVKSPKPVKVTVLTGDAAAKLGALGAQLGDLTKPRTIKVYTKLLTTGKAPKTNTDLYGVPGNAVGGHTLGRPSRLHEQGPEIVDLPRGSRVYPAGRSAQMVRDAANSGLSKADLEDAFYRALCRMPVFRLPDAGRGAYQQGAAY